MVCIRSSFNSWRRRYTDSVNLVIIGTGGGVRIFGQAITRTNIDLLVIKALNFRDIWIRIDLIQKGALENIVCKISAIHDDVIKWKRLTHYGPFVRGIHRSPVNSPHKGQWRGALVLSLISVRIKKWVNNREGGDLRRHRAHFEVMVMFLQASMCYTCCPVVT